MNHLSTNQENSKFRNDIFPTPIWVGNFFNKTIIDRAIELAYAFRSETDDAALVSEAWDDRIVTADKNKFEEKGVTSFATTNLLEDSRWHGIAQYLHKASELMLSDTWDVKGMSLFNLWTTIYPRGGYVPAHIHSCFAVSGVFYLKAFKDCGNIVFQDPSWVAKTANNQGTTTFPTGGTRQEHSPKTGDLLLFPSWLPHWTKQNKTDEDRIILSFNLQFNQHIYPKSA